MHLDRKVIREISYASSAQTRAGRVMIRAVENLTGRPRLIRMARGYDADVAAGRDFWAVMMERYGLTLDIKRGGLENIPTDGPLIVIANHPFGILDGLILGHILSKTRGDFRILANSVFRKAEDINRILLPISFDESKEAVRLNLETRRAALTYLAGGGCIGVFPGGTVSTAARRRARPMDPGWRTFTAKMITRSNATVVPLFFDGANSNRFQRASHLHPTLRLALLINEFKRRVGDAVPIAIGRPLSQDDLAGYAGNPRGMMDYLRRVTYELSPKPITDLSYGYEFEERR